MSLHASGRITGRALEQMHARDKREAERAARAEARQVRMARRLAESTAPTEGDWDTFFSLIDISGGPDACHEWQGCRQWNHRDPEVERFEQGKFKVPGISTYYAHRLVCMHEYNIGFLDPETDISPTCGNHLCCNLRHLVARPHGSTAGADHAEAVPVAEFFGTEVAKQDQRAELEKQADALLAACRSGIVVRAA